MTPDERGEAKSRPAPRPEPVFLIMSEDIEGSTAACRLARGHRGTKELDILVGASPTTRLFGHGGAGISTDFERFLAVEPESDRSNPELLGPSPAVAPIPGTFADMVADIRKHGSCGLLRAEARPDSEDDTTTMSERADLIFTGVPEGLDALVLARLVEEAADGGQVGHPAAYRPRRPAAGSARRAAALLRTQGARGAVPGLGYGAVRPRWPERRDRCQAHHGTVPAGTDEPQRAAGGAHDRQRGAAKACRRGRSSATP